MMTTRTAMRIWAATVCLSIAAVPAAAAVIGHMTTAEPITEARIAQLPQGQQPEWIAYLAKSRALMAADKAALAAERDTDAPPPPPPTGPSGGAGMPLDRSPAWYAGPEARHTADTIISFQTPAGGWGKNVDRSGPPRLRGQHYVPIETLPANAREDIKSADANWSYVGTIDNNATTTEIRFLARVQAQAPGPEGEAYRAAFLKGVRYLLAAQFPNGGWPQVYPLQGGYHDAVTFNDDALCDVATLLASVAARRDDYASVPEPISSAARGAVARAVQLILKTQVVIGGKRTVWGQQHDALTLGPVGARNFEPAALSSNESARLLIFLMRLPNPSPEIRAAISDGVAWLSAHALHGVEWTRSKGPGGRQLISVPGAGPIWARFYDLTEMKPIFGDRDKSIHDDVGDLSAERRNGYSWFGPQPEKAIDAYQVWKERR
jgi:PelA/Pel-15E family pectate lyase